MFVLLSLIVSAYVVYEIVRGRGGRPAVVVLGAVNAALAVWNLFS